MPKTTMSCRAVPSPEGTGRTLRFIGATEDVARDGGILQMDGWQLDAYRSNPVLLWAHQQDQPPIGRAVRVAPGPDGLEFDIEFPAADVYPFADLIGRLYEAGFMRAVSVGFRVLKEREPVASERAAGAQWVSTAQELLELSAVPVGADAGALVAARSACRAEDAVLLRDMGPAFEALARDIEGEARPYDSSGKKIKDPTPEEIAAYEEEKKKAPRELSDDAIAALMQRLDQIAERLGVVSSFLMADEPFDGHAQDAAGGAAPAVEKPVERTGVAPDPDPYQILAKAAAYAKRSD